MKKSKISKIGLSLLIALAFVIPTGAISATSDEPVVIEADENSMTISGNVPSDGIGALFNDGPWPVEITSCDLITPVPSGEHDINITIERPNFGTGFTPVMDGVVDIGYSSVAIDTVTESATATNTDSDDTIYREDGTTFTVWGDMTLTLQTFGETGVVRIVADNPADANGRWEQAGEFIQVRRDFNGDGQADWLIRYNQDGAVSYFTYDGATWTSSALPGIFTVIYAANALTIEWVGTSIGGNVAAMVKEIHSSASPGQRDHYMCVPWAAFDTVSFRPDPDDTSNYLDMPSFHSLDAGIYLTADCTDVYFAFASIGDPITNFEIDVTGGSIFDETTAGITVAGLGTTVVEVMIPRSMLPVGDCNELGFAWDYTLENVGLFTIENNGCVDEPTTYGIIAFDCGCVLMKAFVDIYELSPLPCIDMYDTDFEDQADVYNHWDAFDADSWDGSSPNGSIDTWRLNTYKSHSPGTSFHNSFIEDSYYGNQKDYLQTTIDNSEEYETIMVNFWHYMDGELIERSGFDDKLGDWGQVQYSTTDGASWHLLPTWIVDDYDDPDEYGHYGGQKWYSTEDENPNSGTFGDIIWEEVEGKIEGVSGVSEIILRFEWRSNVCVQNAGWWVDDVSFCGIQDPESDEFVKQIYSVDAFEMCEDIMVYTFPRKFDFEDGKEYRLKYWLLVEDDCNYAVNDQENRFVQEFEVNDYCDLGVTNTIIDYPTEPGDDLVVNSCVTNYGTVPCTDVPLTFSISELVEKTFINDMIEGFYYDVAGQKGFDPYADENWEDPQSLWQAASFAGDENMWHVTDDFFASPDHAWKAGLGDHYPAGQYDALCFNFDAGVLAEDPDWDLDVLQDKVLSWDITFDINIDVGPSDYVWPMMRVDSTWYWFSAPAAAHGSTGGWQTMKYSDFVVPYFNPARDNTLLDTFTLYFGSPIAVNGVGFILAGNAYPNPTSGSSTGAWSGALIDNVKVEATWIGEELHTETIMLGDIDPGETVCIDDCESLVWEDVPTGKFVECKTVPDDHPNPLNHMNDDNMACNEFTVSTQITCMDECDAEHYDLTEGDDENYWHICTSGYDSYLVCNDPETNTYGSSWDEWVILKSDDPRDKDSEASMDWSAESAVWLNLTSLEDIEGYGFDDGQFLVNPAVSDPGSHWYVYQGPYSWGFGGWANNLDDNHVPWLLRTLLMQPSDFIEMESTTPLAGFTDDMGSAFRFYSDGSWDSVGWHIDDISLVGADTGDTIYEENPCDNMDRFILYSMYGGDWWYYNATYGGWCCRDEIDSWNQLHNDVECALVWDVNIDSAYTAELTFDYDFDLETGYDYCYLEISSDGGNTWFAPKAFTGADSGTYTLDITQFIDQNLLIRFRVVTDEAVVSNGFCVKNICINGFVDLEAPITTATLSGTTMYGWYSSPVTFTATATDDVSGVFATYYKIDGGSALTYTAPITISTNGMHQIEYWSVDNVGNEEVHRFTPEFKIDTGSPPSVSITAPGAGLYLFGNKLLSMSKTIIIGGFTVEATASDADSGVYKVTFQLDGTTFGESTASPYTAYCGVKHTGSGTIKAIAEDFTGQSSEDTLDVTYFKFL